MTAEDRKQWDACHAAYLRMQDADQKLVGAKAKAEEAEAAVKAHGLHAKTWGQSVAHLEVPAVTAFHEADRTARHFRELFLSTLGQSPAVLRAVFSVMEVR